jgi:hypothetical protein
MHRLGLLVLTAECSWAVLLCCVVVVWSVVTQVRQCMLLLSVPGLTRFPAQYKTCVKKHAPRAGTYCYTALCREDQKHHRNVSWRRLSQPPKITGTGE